MLSVSKLGAGQEGYYLDSVAQGVEDYYLGHGETPGRWMGSASALLGLEGEVDAPDLRAVLEGRSPVDGTRLIQARKDRVPGFDLTFSAPKSVSVLFGLGDPDTVRAVRAAHDRSVDAALGWLEREACVSRRGIDGVEQISGDGFAAAGFVHRTSRAGDPQLHTHVLVANLTRCDDGRWRTLHGGPVFWQARTAGYLYKAQLRHELTASLGVAWGPVHKGAAEIVGIPAELCAVFSTRRHEIQDELDARGNHSPRAARVAALETRQAKDYGVDIGALRDRWHDQARETGHAPETLTAIGQTVPVPITADNEHAATDVLLGPHGLTEQATTFDRRAVLRGWCEQLPAGAPITTIEALADRTLADARVIALQDRAPYPKYSTVELVSARTTPRRHRPQRRRHRRRRRQPNRHLRMALDARPELSPEQVAAVAAITTSGNGIDVIVAAAGTGKTFSLDAAADAWRHGGYHVIGAALAATAAAQLQTQTGIPSDTIALRTLQLANGTLRFDPRTVVVIDEAAMASTRGLVPLLDAAHDAGAKVVMVGDPHQLNAIDAGGLLNGLAFRLPPIALTENRRQQHAWERDALADLRAGRIADAFDGYNTHDRVLVADTAIDVRNHMAADWHAATLAGDHVLMLAERRYDVDDLNQRARRHLTRNGTITGPALEVDDLTFQAGDRVLCLRNDRRIGVRNGTIGTVTDLDPENRSITIRTDDGTTHELPPATSTPATSATATRSPSTKAKGSPSTDASSSPATPSTAKPATPRSHAAAPTTASTSSPNHPPIPKPTTPNATHPTRRHNSPPRSNPTDANDSRSITTSTPTPSATTSSSSTEAAPVSTPTASRFPTARPTCVRWNENARTRSTPLDSARTSSNASDPCSTAASTTSHASPPNAPTTKPPQQSAGSTTRSNKPATTTTRRDSQPQQP